MSREAPAGGSAGWFERARRVLPGGVNSPVRAFKAVGGQPPFIRSGSGCRIQDLDGNEYIDYLGSWGPMILGHAHPEVVEAVCSAAENGCSFGAPTPGEVLLAEKICSLFPSIEKVRLVNSGTEAAMSALRLARAFTGRSLIVKFDGCYHGHSDGLLVQAGSGVLTLGIPGTPGVPAELARCTLSLPFNDSSALEDAFRQYPDAIAAVIVEPVPGNMGVVPPAEGFLARLLELAHDHGALAIFDEVITGFRLGLGGAQEQLSLTPPLTCLGKILGGGLPIGAYGGRREIMEKVAPEGPVYQAGTLSGNPIAVAAGLKTIEILERERPYARLEQGAARLCDAFLEAASGNKIPLQAQRVGSLFTLFFSNQPVRDYISALKADTLLFARFFRKMLERGIYLAPSQFEACFLSTAHDEAAIRATIQAVETVFAELSRESV